MINSPVSLVRSLKGAPLACLFILLLSAESLRAGALCQATGYSPNSITAALRLLADLCLIEKTSEGWRVPPPVRRVLLQQAGAPESIANCESPASLCESSPQGGEDIKQDSIKFSPPPLRQPARFPRSPASIHADVLDIGNRDSPVLQPLTGNPAGRPLDVPRILDATRLLFGERLHGPASRYPNVRLLLAAIAEAYVRRQSLRKPARVVYANLKSGVDPGSEFLADPISYLPASFLAEAGLGSYTVDACAPDDEVTQTCLSPSHEPAPQTDPSVTRFADVQGLRSAHQVWELAWENLRGELPRSVFRRYLEGCCLAAYDPEASLFIVSAGGEQARLWLQDRLTARLSHLLSGICDRPCSVQFEVTC